MVGEGTFALTCPQCQKPYEAIYGTARAKRSRGQRRSNSRVYDLRYQQHGVESFIQFNSDTYDDAELRARDMFVLSCINGKVFTLDNKTIGQFFQINNPPVGLFGMLVALAIIIGVIWAVFALLF